MRRHAVLRNCCLRRFMTRVPLKLRGIEHFAF